MSPKKNLKPSSPKIREKKSLLPDKQKTLNILDPRHPCYLTLMSLKIVLN